MENNETYNKLDELENKIRFLEGIAVFQEEWSKEKIEERFSLEVREAAAKSLRARADKLDGFFTAWIPEARISLSTWFEKFVGRNLAGATWIGKVEAADKVLSEVEKELEAILDFPRPPNWTLLEKVRQVRDETEGKRRRLTEIGTKSRILREELNEKNKNLQAKINDLEDELRREKEENCKLKSGIKPIATQIREARTECDEARGLLFTKQDKLNILLARCEHKDENGNSTVVSVYPNGRMEFLNEKTIERCSICGREKR